MPLIKFFNTKKSKNKLSPQETGNKEVLKETVDEEVLKEACLLTDDTELIDFCTTKKYPTKEIHKFCIENPKNETCKALQVLNEEITGGKKRRVKKSRKSRKSRRKNHKKRATRKK
jgi:hypothetical protein